MNNPSRTQSLAALERDLRRSRENLARAKEEGDARTIVRERSQIEYTARKIVAARYRLFGG